MADYDNIYRNGGPDGHSKNWPEEPEGGYDVSEKQQSPKMPPRNILETDSAKYTAEYIKEVVKGLYTIEPTPYSETEEEPEEEDDGFETKYEPKFGPKYNTGEVTSPRRPVTNSAERRTQAEMAEPPQHGRRQESYTDDRRASMRGRTDRNVNEERREVRRESRIERQSEEMVEHLPEESAEWKPEWKQEKQERQERQQKRRPERSLQSEREWQDGQADTAFEEERVIHREEFVETPPESVAERRRPQRESSLPRGKNQEAPQGEEEEFTPESFLKSFEDKSRYEKIDYNPRPRERKTFSSLRADSNTGELAGALSGKPAKKLSGERPYRERREPSPGYNEEYTAKPVETDDEYVYIKQLYDTPDTKPSEERAIYVTSDEVPSERQQEKIPIIINRQIEPRAKKTAEEYRNVSRSSHNSRPIRSMEPIETKSRGANIFAALFMLIAIGIIGLLVWKINSLSNEAKAVQDNAEEVTRLESQVKSLSQTNGELSAEVDRLTKEVEDLGRENERLAEMATEEQPEETSGDSEAQSPANPELVNGYYTVKSGDTLWNISQKFLGNGDEYLKIATANGIDPAQSLFAGQKLLIPGQ